MLPGIALAALLGLAQEGPSALVEQLRSPVSTQRERASRRLRALGRDAEPELRQALQDPDREVSIRAGAVLDVLDAVDRITPRLRAAFPALAPQLVTTGALDWTEAFLEASRVFEEAPPRLTTSDLAPLVGPALIAADTAAKRRICDRVVAHGLRGAASLFTPLLKDPDPVLRTDAARVLARLGGRRLLPHLFALLADQDERPARMAIAAIVDEGWTDGGSLLLLVAKTREGLRQAALKAIVDLKARDMAPVLSEWLGELSDAERPDVLQALGQLGGPESAPRIRPFLRSEARDVRRTACRALVSVRDPEAATQLLPLLDDPEPRVREAAVDALDLLDAPSAVDVLRKRLADSDVQVRRAAAAALQGFDDPETVAALLGKLDDEDDSLRTRALEVLGWRKETRDEFRRRLKDPDGDRRAFAVKFVGDHGDTASIPLLLQTLDQGPPGSRIAAAQALVRFGVARAAPGILALVPVGGDDALELLVTLRSPLALQPLKDLVKKPDADQAFKAVRLLKRLRHPEAEEILRRLAETAESAPLREEACRALRDVSGCGATAALRERMKDDAADVRFTAAQLLSELGVEDAFAPMVDLAGTHDASRRHIVVGILSTRGEARATALLKGLLDDPDVEVRIAVLKALVARASSITVSELVRLLEDSKVRIRLAAYDALAELDPAAARKEFRHGVRLLDEPEGNVRQGALDVLARTGASEAVPRILSLLRDDDIQVQVVDALGRLEAREALPALRALFDEQPYAWLHRALLEALAGLHDRESIPRVVRSLDASAEEVRWAAVRALGTLDARETAPRLKAFLLRPAEPSSRKDAEWEAIDLLARWEGEKELPLFVELLRHHDGDLSDGARRAIVAMNPRGRFPELVGRLGDPGIGFSIGIILRELRAVEAIPALRELLRSGASPDVRCQAAYVLEGLRASDAIPDLVRGAGADDVGLRDACLRALSELGAPQTLDVARAFLKTGDFELQRTAVRSIGDGGAREGVADVVPFLRSPELYLRLDAIRTLMLLEARDQAEAIRGLLGDDAAEVRHVAALALAKLGAAGDGIRLAELLSDPHDDTVAAALDGIAELGAVEAAPPVARMLRAGPEFRLRAARTLCRLGLREGVEELLLQDSNLEYLNAVRRAELWRALVRTSDKVRVGETWKAFIGRLAQSRGLAVDWLDTEYQDSILQWTGTHSLPETLDHAGLSYVLEPDRLRILPALEARAFWKAWAAEPPKK